MRAAAGWEQEFFRVEGYRVTTYHRAPRRRRATGPTIDTEATVKVWVGDERLDRGRRGQRPGQRPRPGAAPRARRPATRSSTTSTSPTTGCGSSTASADTGAVVRVLIDSTDGERAWTTIGVSTNIIEASWQALTDALVWGLLHTGQ